MLGGFAAPAPKAAPLRAHAAAAGRPGDAAPASFAAVFKAIARLEEAIDSETLALRNRARVDLNDFNARKSQGLLELNRALRQLDQPVTDAAVLAGLAGLRGKLDANRAVLRVHLEAVREIANLVADAIRDAESDGTYSPSIRAGGGRP